MDAARTAIKASAKLLAKTRWARRTYGEILSENRLTKSLFQVGPPVMAETMTPMDVYPEHYLVKRFPTPDQLSAMGARNSLERFEELFDRGNQGT